MDSPVILAYAAFGRDEDGSTEPARHLNTAQAVDMKGAVQIREMVGVREGHIRQARSIHLRCLCSVSEYVRH